MKVEVTKAQVKFEPITLTITFESRNELLDMFARHALKNEQLIPHMQYFTGRVTQTVGKLAMIDAIKSIPNKYSKVPLLVVLEEVILR